MFSRLRLGFKPLSPTVTFKVKQIIENIERSSKLTNNQQLIIILGIRIGATVLIAHVMVTAWSP